MRSATLTALCMVSIIAFSLTANSPSAHASTPPQGFTATIEPDYVAVSLIFQISQNLSALQSSFAFPQWSGALTAANSSNVASLVQQALITRSSHATVDTLAMSLSSSPFTNTSSLQQVSMSMNFQVRGIQALQGSFQKVDFSWKSFRVLQNITLGTFEVNNIGASYLQRVAAQISTNESASSSSTFFTFRNTVNNRAVSAVNLPGAAASISLLNFSRLAPALDTWKVGYDSSSRTVTRSLNVASGLGMVIVETVNEPQATPIRFVLRYDVLASVSSPLRSSFQGDVVIVTFADTSETIMGTAIVAILATGSVAFVYERRTLSKSTGQKRKR